MASSGVVTCWAHRILQECESSIQPTLYLNRERSHVHRPAPCILAGKTEDRQDERGNGSCYWLPPGIVVVAAAVPLTLHAWT